MSKIKQSNTSVTSLDVPMYMLQTLTKEDGTILGQEAL